ncbi:hypothetical protein Ga0466249_005350 [Sporomusaceae bacterium BoRhaA]|uniref:hypothetical protein n=1 Tax=Pelorhabdus rhamnosifermentans TaxID=2772457 RepID=UPI001C060830|nr:hypothetical protein [Pelorhabdus rhamnosifermentans]MBU2704196.1 hypothetical protein [Pelorhabdus rhamnosifermentans]
MKICDKNYDCNGECWINVAGDPPFAGAIADKCNGTLEEQKINDDYFNGRKTKDEIVKFYDIKAGEQS